MKSSRRTFVMAAGSALASTRIWGANERIPVAVVGLGGRGRAHMGEYLQIADAEVVALCDVNQAALERGQAQVAKGNNGKQPKGYDDMRKVFDDKDVAAVSMPLPNHWHALATILACQAGKDVYIEKPACHNIWEGRKMVEAARKYERMVQIGSQSRSIKHKQKAIGLLKSGVIGEVYSATGLCYKGRAALDRKPDLATPPPGIDWDKFLGPAPMRPFNENRFAYNWHWFWDTGNGDIGNQGVHEMDIARWGMDLGLPKTITCTGNRYAWNDGAETPNTQTAVFNYGEKEITFEVRNVSYINQGQMGMTETNVIGDIFYGTEGVLSVDGRGFQVYKGQKREKVTDEKREAREPDTRGHMENFLAACRTRRYQDLNADVEIGVLSADLCHLANIAYRVGRTVQFDAKEQKFMGDSEADRHTTRMYRKGYVIPEKV
ncbi:MAG: Gfo/Idh/MocA family oxidoreductase [Bryobacteraceae bacterium]|nr:Gfo/Idh/MocA family oxidoreductase [Bryobacteraceae bacterium]